MHRLVTAIKVINAEIGDYAELRVYADENLLNLNQSGENILIASDKGKEGYYLKIPCTIEDGVISVPDFPLAATTDDLVDPNKLYKKAEIHDRRSRFRHTIAANFAVPAAEAEDFPITWAQILIYNNQSYAYTDPGTLNADQILAIIEQNQTINITPDAGKLVKGKVKLDEVPASSTNPIAVGVNSPLFTTINSSLEGLQDQINNLQITPASDIDGGTFGSPITGTAIDGGSL